MEHKYQYWPEFYTATVIKWTDIFESDSFKDIIIGCLRFLALNRRVEVHGFVVMSNHIHLIWEPISGHSPSEVKSAFMKFTSHQIIQKLKLESSEQLCQFKVRKYDRQYQIWQRDSLSVELFTPKVFEQKLNYIHYNPVKAGLCSFPENYFYSSARFYHDGKDNFGFLTNYLG